jgi:UDP-N-acetyl-D-mannosaminuronic acid dehydrogenase
MKSKKVVIMGLGYIGLPTAAVISETNWLVHGVDVKPNIIDTINAGNIHIVEPGLEDVISSSVKKGSLKASLEPVEADVFVIAVPTPFKNDYQPDITYVINALDKFSPKVNHGNLIILESTSPVGTIDKLVKRLNEIRPDLTNKVYFAYCPERVLPGNVLFELKNNDRVIGGINPESTALAIEFYSNFVKGKLHSTNSRTAEMCKLTENAFRDANIAFANELSMICEKADINVWELIDLSNKHPRVNILKPGIGVGGHCLAVDPWFLVADFPNEAKLIRCSREVNIRKTAWVVDVIKKEVEEVCDLKKRKIALMGLSYKPDIDDVRESPAVDICIELHKLNTDILVVEPHIISHKDLQLTTIDTAIDSADVIVFLVKHSMFLEINLKGKPYFDFCGISENPSFTLNNGNPQNIKS